MSIEPTNPGDDAPTKFWETLRLDQMSRAQWESLCDGCGRCCLIKLEDEDTGQYYWTNVACRALDCTNGGCTAYQNRKQVVPECIILTPENLEEKQVFLPDSCAYKRLHHGKALPNWHPLITGDPSSVVDADISVAEKCLSEDHVHDEDLPNFIVDWD